MASRALKRMIKETRASLKGVTHVVDAVHYDTRSFAAAALPASTDYFTAVRNKWLNSLVKPGEVEYSLIITAIGIQIEGALENLKLFINGTAFYLHVAGKNFPTWLTHMLPGGGGYYGAVSVGQMVAAPIVREVVSNGVPTHKALRVLKQPIRIDPDLAFKAVILGDTTKTLVATAVQARVLLYGVEIRPVN